MKNSIENIYELLYRPIITPYNLLENAKLPNYEYVSYYKGKNGLVAELKCLMEDNTNAVFHYHFDDTDNLINIFMTTGNQKKLMFDRQEKLNKLAINYLKSKDTIKETAI